MPSFKAVVVMVSGKMSMFEFFQNFSSAPVAVTLDEGHSKWYGLKDLPKSTIVPSFMAAVAIVFEQMSMFKFLGQTD